MTCDTRVTYVLCSLAKDIIAVKSAEGLNPFSVRFPFTKWSIGVYGLDRWKLTILPKWVLKMMLFFEGYYLDAAVSLFKINRLNCPAVLFRLKWFHGSCARMIFCLFYILLAPKKFLHCSTRANLIPSRLAICERFTCAQVVWRRSGMFARSCSSLSMCPPRPKSQLQHQTKCLMRNVKENRTRTKR